MRRHRQPHARGSKLAAAPARRRRVRLPGRTHHDRLALLDLVAGGLEPGHNLALCGRASVNKLVGQAAFASGPGIAHIVIWAPTNAAGSGAQVKAGRRPAWAPRSRPTGHRARQRGHEDLLDGILHDQLAPGAAHGAMAGRQAPLHGAGSQRRHRAICKWIRQTNWRPMARGRPVSCPAAAQRMSPMQPLGWRIPLAHAITQPCRSSQTAGRAAEGPASPGGSGRAVPSAGPRPCGF